MSTTAKLKWIISLVLGGILLITAMFGGKWEPTYAADGSLNAIPEIDYIYPSAVPAGSGDVVMIIGGSNFGEVEDFIRIWIRDAQHEYNAAPMEVIETGISVVITDTLLVEPNVYSITVVKSNGLSVPTIPPNPIYDQVSNSVNFLVYEAIPAYLPIIEK
jgi:hypothetical protein